MGVLGIFGTIYQQNNVVKLCYEKQRLEQHYQRLEHKKNRLLIMCAQAKNLDVLKALAVQQFGMTPLSLCKLITFTTTPASLAHTAS